MDEEEYGAVSADGQRMGWVLSLAGTIPFIALALFLLINPDAWLGSDQLIFALTTYAAVILSFLGGIRWGVALTRAEGRPTQFVFILAIAPALIGWFCLFVGTPTVFVLLVLAFLLQLVWDYGAWCTDVMREWFVNLRMVITAIVVASLLVAFFATL